MQNVLINPYVLAVAAAITVAVTLCASLLAARSRRVLDQPNDRSSHAMATPRIGGLAIALGWLAGLFAVAAFSQSATLALQVVLLVATSLVALGLGLVDDRLQLTPALKLAGQIGVAALFTALFGPLAALPVPGVGEVALAPFWGVLFTVFWIAAFMNAFNFMDGVNGLAAGAAAIGLGWVAVIAMFAGAGVLAIPALLLALAAAAFLRENLVRGRLFMGDNGSQMIGFAIAAFAVLGANWTGARMSYFVVPVIFLPLIFDVGWTLVSRAIRRQNVLTAHREHLYQLLLRSGASHGRVAIIYIGLVTLCAGAAVLMLTVAPALHALAPALLSAAFIVIALIIHARAKSAGLLAAGPALRAPNVEDKRDEGALHAAE